MHLGGAQRGGGVGGEERIAGAGGEDDHPALLHVPLGAAADIGFADGGHRDGGLHPGGNAAFLQRRLHGQRVHHRGQHAHVVRLGAFHAAGGAGDATKDVAAADHDADLHAHADDIADIGGDGADGVVVEAEFASAHQGLARQLQQDALVDRAVWHASRVPDDCGGTLIAAGGRNKFPMLCWQGVRPPGRAWTPYPAWWPAAGRAAAAHRAGGRDAW